MMEKETVAINSGCHLVYVRSLSVCRVIVAAVAARAVLGPRVGDPAPLVGKMKVWLTVVMAKAHTDEIIRHGDRFYGHAWRNG